MNFMHPFLEHVLRAGLRCVGLAPDPWEGFPDPKKPPRLGELDDATRVILGKRFHVDARRMLDHVQLRLLGGPVELVHADTIEALQRTPPRCDSGAVVLFDTHASVSMVHWFNNKPHTTLESRLAAAADIEHTLFAAVYSYTGHNTDSDNWFLAQLIGNAVIRRAPNYSECGGYEPQDLNSIFVYSDSD